MIPDWQYGSGGCHHGGDIARDRQERAVEDVAEQAAELREAEDP